MKKIWICGVSAVVACASVLSVQRASAQVTLFNDTFGSGSTLNAAPTAPTANSTSYEQGFGITATALVGVSVLAISCSKTESQVALSTK